MSQEQQDQLAKGKTDATVIFKQAIDQRLRIKKLQISQIGLDSSKDKKVMVFFVNPALLEPPKPTEMQRVNTLNRRASSIGSQVKAALVADKAKDEPADQLYSNIGNFDIRKGICTNLLDPDPSNN